MIRLGGELNDKIFISFSSIPHSFSTRFAAGSSPLNDHHDEFEVFLTDVYRDRSFPYL